MVEEVLRVVGLVTDSLSNALLRGKTRGLAPHTVRLVRRLARGNIRFITTDKHRCSGRHELFSRVGSRVSCVKRGNSVYVRRKGIVSHKVVTSSLTYHVVSRIGGSPGFSVLVSERSTYLVRSRRRTFMGRVMGIVRGAAGVMSSLDGVRNPFLGVTVYGVVSSAGMVVRCLRRLRRVFNTRVGIIASKGV